MGYLSSVVIIHTFLGIRHARVKPKISEWQKSFNEVRSHSSWVMFHRLRTRGCCS